MTFTIVTHVPHIRKDNQYFAYAPYVREMNIWIQHADKIIIVAPIITTEITPLDIAYVHNNIDFRQVPEFNVKSFKSIVSTLFAFPKLIVVTFKAMKATDHIHLRCPGNMGLLGSLVQILFPKKIKTAKYAGNWDPSSLQPFTYRLQQRILSSTLLTKNMKVLVYGKWPNMSQNIIPFFTATYTEAEKNESFTKDFDNTVRLVFAGALVKGKNPMYALQLLKKLQEEGLTATLEFYGDGPEKELLEDYIALNNLSQSVSLKGKQSGGVLKEAYGRNHFVILPSESEGWPKAIAEGMFWGCIPIATAVSCVPFMLDYGKRGIVTKKNPAEDVIHITQVFSDRKYFDTLSLACSEWSRQYTLDVFAESIKKLLQNNEDPTAN